ncbi:hypothetical protein J5N97_028243 [Dioscorea zingiberensis]|uniref:Uncharacterized protein n=1 Tax=Dioscorea zingiberensis TaxID=325984 RepID=A0A9D5H4P1_9LILI|nr:hypothetical protein J5N97_028243 [Dioscorea zingiberensis]
MDAAELDELLYVDAPIYMILVVVIMLVGTRNRLRSLPLMPTSSHPKAKDLLNKPIPYFEELRLICGDDQATGLFARSIYEQFGATKNEGINEKNPKTEDMDTSPTESASQHQETPHVSSTAPNNSRGSRSSKANFDSTMEEIAKGVSELSCTLREAKKHWIESLSAILFAMDDEFDEDDLDRAFEVLCHDEQSARGFVHRRPAMRRRWMENFLASRRAGS